MNYKFKPHSLIVNTLYSCILAKKIMCMIVGHQIEFFDDQGSKMKANVGREKGIEKKMGKWAI